MARSIIEATDMLTRELPIVNRAGHVLRPCRAGALLVLHRPAVLIICTKCKEIGTVPSLSVCCPTCRSTFYCSDKCRREDVDMHSPGCRGPVHKAASSAVESFHDLHMLLYSHPWVEAVLCAALVGIAARYTGACIAYDSAKMTLHVVGSTLRKEAKVIVTADLTAVVAAMPLTVEFSTRRDVVCLVPRNWMRARATRRLAFELGVLETAVSQFWPTAALMGELMIDVRGMSVHYSGRPSLPFCIRTTGERKNTILGPLGAMYEKRTAPLCTVGHSHAKRSGVPPPCMNICCSACLRNCDETWFVCSRCQSDVVCSNVCARDGLRAHGKACPGSGNRGTVETVCALQVLMASRPWVTAVMHEFLREVGSQGHMCAVISSPDATSLQLMPLRSKTYPTGVYAEDTDGSFVVPMIVTTPVLAAFGCRVMLSVPNALLESKPPAALIQTCFNLCNILPIAVPRCKTYLDINTGTKPSVTLMLDEPAASARTMLKNTYCHVVKCHRRCGHEGAIALRPDVKIFAMNISEKK